MCFNGNETDVCVIHSIFSGNEQQKVQFLFKRRQSSVTIAEALIDVECTELHFVNSVKKIVTVSIPLLKKKAASFTSDIHHRLYVNSRLEFLKKIKCLKLKKD